MKITYCKTWNKIPYDILTPERAKRMHDKKKRYELVYEDDARRIAEVEISFVGGWGCIIRYFDDLMRRYQDYVWLLIDDGRLFWSQKLDYHYRGDAPEIAGGKEWYYGQDGRLMTREGNMRQLHHRDDYPPIDVSDHYEPLPAFGDHEAFYRLIRHGPPERTPTFDGSVVLVEPPADSTRRRRSASKPR